MGNLWRRGLALALSVCLAGAALAGCSKKESKTDYSAAVMSVKDGGSISIGAANLYFRYSQAQFENGVGAFYKQYSGVDNLWTADLTYSGEAYGNIFKEQMLQELEHMLLAREHAADYGIELTDEEKSAIKEAAEEFIASNSAEALEKMTATQETAEEMLTLYTIQQKMETAMSADVDTEVSDEEAAQRTVSYVQFMAVEETEEETEEMTEDMSEGMSESVGEIAGMLEETVSEAVSEAALELESEVKTNAAEAVSEAVSEAADESVAEEATEALTEGETESPAMQAARADAMARAQAFLAVAEQTDDFQAAAQEVTAGDTNSYTSSYTFGKDDTYPNAAIIEATEGLEDNTLVDHVVVVDTYYYVLHVDDAFDEAATEAEKERIVDQRRDEQISSLYTEWAEGTELSLDSAAWTGLLFDISLTQETEAVTEGAEDAEAVSEAVSEAAEEAVTEAAEAVSEAVSEAAADLSEAMTELSEVMTEISEAATEAATE